VVILVKGYLFIDRYIGRYINEGICWVLAGSQTLFQQTEPESTAKILLSQNLESIKAQWKQQPWLNLVGIAFAIILLYMLGVFLASIMGRATWRLIEKPFLRIPVVKAIYPHIKMVADFLFSERKLDYSRVIAVEYPRDGVWSLGLVTGNGFQAVTQVTGRDYISVFIPSSPTPMTGYVVTIPRENAIDLPLTIDQAFRFTVSGGVIGPQAAVNTMTGDQPTIPTEDSVASADPSSAQGPR
jgi:uncharacterized membrane protein